MALVDMKLDKRAKEEDSEVKEDRYPFGLRIHLDDEQLEKLGVDELPKVGKEKMMIAMVEVTDVSASDTMLGGERRSVGLQIKSVAFKETEDKQKEAEEKFYGGER